jgi:hypothetical protein
MATNPHSYLHNAALAGAEASLGEVQGISAAGIIDVGELDAAIVDIANDDLIIGDHNDSHLAKKEAIADVVSAMVGTASATALAQASGVITVTPSNANITIGADSIMFVTAAGVPGKDLASDVVAAICGSAASTGLSNTGGVATVAAKIPHLEAALLKGTTVVPMSFETNEATTTKIYFPMKVTINKIRGIAMKAIAASDNGTITCGNVGGNSTSGVITCTASDAINTAYSVTPSDNNVVLADGYYQLVSAKSTAGGKCLVTLEWTRTA